MNVSVKPRMNNVKQGYSRDADLPTPKFEGGRFFGQKGVDSDQKGVDLFRNPSVASRVAECSETNPPKGGSGVFAPSENFQNLQ